MPVGVEPDTLPLKATLPLEPVKVFELGSVIVPVVVIAPEFIVPAKVAFPLPSNVNLILDPGEEPVPICKVAALVPPFLI